MMTLKKYFSVKDRKFFGGYFLSCKVDGNLYVICSAKDHHNLVNVVYGNTIASVRIDKSEHFDSLTEDEMRKLIGGLFDYHEEPFVCWHKLSQPEAIGKFATIVLE
jgi:hypothetical protein